MKRLNLALTVTVLCVAFISPLALARGHDNHKRVAYARVISVDPIIKTVQRRTPVESCWTEQVREETPVYRHAGGHSPNTASTLLGSVIGGAIGHSVGAGNENKKVGTVVGALLGATIGRDVGRRQSNEQYSHTEVNYRDVRRCIIEDRTNLETVPVGYNVTYAYRGETYTTRTRQHPGKKIKVAVRIRPLED
ncbi:glycine zipper 2TM domain-containing protein [Teredinibacter franksiae]|uniref:glycine zipper 2TM domain-containing protein n=1 Tax=Teredinibacter franksiae TaxID=2761453 RepID=UPI001628BE3F|nr:glycine zipper 2TM domain-containing protein [Teredinibacter franksiae]